MKVSGQLEKTMRLKQLTMAAVFVMGSTLGTGNAMAEEPSAPYTVETMCGIVQPMKHDLKGRLPILLWEYPQPLGEDAVKLRQDGRLRKAIDELAKRGIAITVRIDNVEAAMAMA